MKSTKYYGLIALLTLCTHVSNFGMEPINPRRLTQKQRAALEPIFLARFQSAQTKEQKVYWLLGALEKQSNNPENQAIIEAILINMGFKPTITNMNNFIAEVMQRDFKQKLIEKSHSEQLQYLRQQIIWIKQLLHENDNNDPYTPYLPIGLEVLNKLLQEVQYSGG